MATRAAQAVTEWVRGAVGPGVETRYGELAGPGDCCEVKAAPASPAVRRYASGGGVYRFAYEVYLRVRPLGEGGRLDGLAALSGLAARVEAGEVPGCGIEWASHAVKSLPCLFRAEQGGEAVYQMAAELTYIVRS